MRNTTKFSYPIYPTENGYLTEKIKLKYISSAIAKNILPQKAHRIANIVSLFASNDILNPIQFWQLHSVIGQNRIVNIVKDFYERVYNDEKRFSSIFSQIAGIEHHINSQSSMWIDVMGGGPTYQGGEYRLNFHHTHNAS